MKKRFRISDDFFENSLLVNSLIFGSLILIVALILGYFANGM